MKTISIIFIILSFSIQSRAQEKNIFSLSRDVKTYVSMPSTFGAMNAYNKTDSVAKDSVCDCKANLPLEIGVTSLVFGVPSYYLWRSLMNIRPDSLFDFSYGLIPESLFLLMFTLGPIAEGTSGCQASNWHTLWIGFSSTLISSIVYFVASGSQPKIRSTNFDIVQYAMLGFVPSVASSIIFNKFLKPIVNKNQSFLIFPSIGRENQACLNMIGRF